MCLADMTQDSIREFEAVMRSVPGWRQGEAVMNFRIGQRVVCVDASPSRLPSSTQLVLKAIYTVRGFDPESRSGGLYLFEVSDDPPRPPHKMPHGWRGDRFRPLIERKTDISIFERLLDPTRHKIEEEV